MLGERLPDSVSVVVRLKDVGSTMDYAKKIVHFPHITIVVAEKQYSGRGRWGRKWVSPRGGLWFSLVLSCVDPSIMQFRAGLATCLAIRELYDIDVRLRWPNDMVFGGKKLGGVLVEHVPEAGKCIVGIGVNVNNKVPRDAISLSGILGHEVEVEEFLATIVEKLEKNLFLSPAELIAQLEKMVYGVGKYTLVEDSKGRNYMGVFRRICGELGLELELLDGKKLCFKAEDAYRVYWI